jgi:hypothetical protein
MIQFGHHPCWAIMDRVVGLMESLKLTEVEKKGIQIDET